jgi:DNA-binding GntR family transcriptional regulator
MNKLPKLNTAYMVEQTYAVLKEQILRRHYSPNEKLLIPDLAEQLGVSKSPVRDALSRLEVEGLVRTVAKVGTFVKGIDEKTAVEIMECRLMIDYWVADKIPQLEKQQISSALQELRLIIEEASTRLERNEFEAVLDSDLDSRFHQQLLQLGGNHKMIETYCGLLNVRPAIIGYRWITPEMCRTTWDQHYLIAEALSSGNTEQLKQRMEEHLNYSRDNLAGLIRQNGGVL